MVELVLNLVFKSLVFSLSLFLDRSLLKTALNAVGISDNDLYVTILKKDYPKVGVTLLCDSAGTYAHAIETNI